MWSLPSRVVLRRAGATRKNPSAITTRFSTPSSFSSLSQKSAFEKLFGPRLKSASESSATDASFGDASLFLAGVMGATAALAAVVTTATRLDNCYGTFDNVLSSSTSLSSSISSNRPTKCDEASKSTPIATSSKEQTARLRRKKTTLVVANDAASTAAAQAGSNDDKHRTSFLQRLSTREEISKLKKKETEILKRWERDEDGWRELPSRVWPAYQPNPEQLQPILAEIKLLGCLDPKPKRNKEQRNISRELEEADEENFCTQLLFDMATTFVFYGLDPEAGLNQYRRLATERGHVDSMVACGIVQVEGIGVPLNEKEGLSWLQRAAEFGNPQALYELGALYYTGLEDVLEENPEKAFELFEQAAAHDHTGALYMTADCLAEGEGTPKSVARAVPLFYKAAERGHRYSRQRIRELLARID